MLTLIDGEKTTRLEWVYNHLSDGFSECKKWLVVFSEDTYTIYGLGFDPFCLDDVEDLDDWHWPTNDTFHNIVSELCKNDYEFWKIVEVK